jgi:ankyrin repeat protein
MAGISNYRNEILCRCLIFLISFSAYHQGVDVNMGDYDGRTALHLAAAEGHIRCVRFLLDICRVKHDPKDR